MVLWAFLLQALAGSIIPPVAFIGCVSLLFVPSLKEGRRRLGLVLAVFGLLSVGGNLPVVIDELAHPESAPAFMLTALAVLAASVATVAGLALFRDWSPRPVLRLGFGAGAVFVVGAVASLAIAGNTPSDVALPSDLEVVAQGVAWTQSEMVLASGQSGVWVDNRDGIRHTFTIPELGVDLEIPALKSRRIDVAGPAGTYQIVCAVPGHESMTGTLVLIE